MKIKILLCSLFLSTTLQLYAQTKTNQTSNPLIGTWIEKTDTLEKIKVITPTHFYFIVFKNKAKKPAFASMGTYSIENGKYVEQLQIANFKTNTTSLSFNYRVSDNKFYQQGAITFADSTKEQANHIFTKETLPAQQTEAIGTWNLISSTYTNGYTTLQNSGMTEIFTITPTHWISITENKETKYVHAVGGTYTKKGNKHLFKFYSLPIEREVNFTIEGDKMINKVDMHHTNIYQKVNTKTAKVVFAK